MLEAPPTGLLNASRLAKMLGVSHTTVANWHAEGMPCAHTEPSGRRMYDPEACAAWAGRHKGWSRHGGKRRGAGRPRKAQPAEPGLDRRYRAAELLDQICRRERPPEDAIDADSLAKMTLGELRVLAELYDDVGTSPANVERARQLVDLRAKIRAERQAEGELLAADEVERTWTDHLRSLRQALDRFSVEATPAIVSAAQIDPARSGAVQEELRRLVTDLLRDLAHDGG